MSSFLDEKPLSKVLFLTFWGFAINGFVLMQLRFFFSFLRGPPPEGGGLKS